MKNAYFFSLKNPHLLKVCFHSSLQGLAISEDWGTPAHRSCTLPNNNSVPSSQFWHMATLLGGGVPGREYCTQKWLIFPFFWGNSGTAQLPQGHTGWFYSLESQWGIELPAFGSTAGYLNHWRIQPVVGTPYHPWIGCHRGKETSKNNDSGYK